MDFNTPEVVKDTASFQRAASKIGYTFNWFYADAEHIAYFNSGSNPVRAKGVNHDFPVAGAFEWRAGTRTRWQARFTPFNQHPQAVDQSYLVSWNNKQARGYRSADANAYSSTYRSVLLEDRVKAGIAGAKKMTLPQLIDAMEVAGHRRPARARGPAAGAEGARQAEGPGAARRGGQAARLAPRRRPAARPQPRRRLRAQRRDPDHGRLVAALGRRAVPARAGQARLRAAHQDGRDRQPAEQPRRPHRLGLPGLVVRLREQGPAQRARAARPRAVLARVLRGGQPQALPRGLAALARRGA